MRNKRILLTAALPLLMGSRCGIMFDFTETFLITDPVHLIVLKVDDGNIDAVAYDRPAILLKRHTFGFESLLEDPIFTVEDGVATYEGHCKKERKSRQDDRICTFDHMFELPFGIAFDITMLDARIDVGYLDANVTAKFDNGFFHGLRLAVPELDITAGSADIDLHYAGIPESIVIEVEEGDVTLALPAGDYLCMFDAENGDVTIDATAVTCSDTATIVLDVHVGQGDITLAEATP